MVDAKGDIQMATYDMPVAPPSADPNQKSLGELFTDLTRESATLVRQEVALARTEISQKASQMGKDIGLIAAGGAIAYAGLIVILLGIAFGLIALGMAAWAAYLLVGIVVGIIGGLITWQGLSGLKRADPMPRETVETLKEDAQWAKEQTH
jgi:uncharacterized membrane protein